MPGNASTSTSTVPTSTAHPTQEHSPAKSTIMHKCAVRHVSPSRCGLSVSREESHLSPNNTTLVLVIRFTSPYDPVLFLVSSTHLSQRIGTTLYLPMIFCHPRSLFALESIPFVTGQVIYAPTDPFSTGNTVLGTAAELVVSLSSRYPPQAYQKFAF